MADEATTQATAPPTVASATVPAAGEAEDAGLAAKASSDATSDTPAQKDATKTIDESKTTEESSAKVSADRAEPLAAEKLDEEAANGDSAETPSGKKQQKRKSNAGVPEHKGKKLNRKKSMPDLHLNAQPGEHWYVQMKGYPPWPAIICDEDMLPISLLSKRPVSAKRPDGTYREDFEEGGKNARDRRYPVMFLGTNEFAWQVNTELNPLDLDELKTVVERNESGKKSKALWEAYQIASEDHDLQYFKEMLREHEMRRIEDMQRALDEEAAKKAKKEKPEKVEKPAKKAKSKDDEDVEMPDADNDADAGQKKKASKKRKKDPEGEDEAPKKTKIILKGLKSVDDEAAPAPKKPRKSTGKVAPETEEDKTKPSPQADENLTEAEKLEKKQKTILYLRHKLQKGLLARDHPPRIEEMNTMADHLTVLEQYTDLEPEIIRGTKINKVLKVIMKLASIPREEEFKFKERCGVLLNIWSKALAADEANAAAEGVDASTNGVHADKPERSVDEAEKKTTTENGQTNGEAEIKVAPNDAPKDTPTASEKPEADAASAAPKEEVTAAA